MNRRKFIVFLILISTVWYLSGCDYRDIVKEKSRVGVYFQIDWSDFPGEELPTGVSIYCYPKNGKMPYIYKSNEIYEVEADMPPGTYDILVFNQVEAEFETLLFSGMDSYSTARVDIVETEKPYWGLMGDQPVASDPEWFALDTLPGFNLTEEMFYGNEAHYIFLKPQNMIYTATAVFRVFRSEKIFKNYGEMSGLAGGLMLGGGRRVGPAHVQLFDDVIVYPYDGDMEVGEVTATFHTFGLPQDESNVGGEPADNLIHYRFFLVDERTFNNFVFKAGDRITVSDSARTLYVELGHNSEIPQEQSRNADPDRPGILPDVAPAHSSGFDAKVKQWGNEIIIDL